MFRFRALARSDGRSNFFTQQSIQSESSTDETLIPSTCDDSFSDHSSSASLHNNAGCSSHPLSRSFSILRWPILLLVGTIIVLELLAYVMVRQFVVLYEMFFVWTGMRRRLRNNLNNASSYEEWACAATTLDTHFGRVAWRSLTRSGDYNYRLIRSIYRRLRNFRVGLASDRRAQPIVQKQSNLPDQLQRAPFDLPKLAALCLESACKPNIGNIDNHRLYSKTLIGTKTLIESFKKETCASLDSLLKAKVDPSDPLHAWKSKEAKNHFFTQTAQLYGVTALCLSGGASFAFHHLGVIKALWKSDALPNIISGTSADTELEDVLDAEIYIHLTACDDSWFCRLKRLMTEGVLFSQEKWEKKLEWVTHGTLTFKEAFRKTGRILNISVVSGGAAGSRSHQKCLNYITAPNILISSAVLASSAIPGVISPVQLKIKHTAQDNSTVIEPFIGWGETFQDGSLKMDVPLRELHQLFNVNFTIVSQVNPHIAVFFYQAQGGSGAPVAHRAGKGWRGGFVMSTLERYLKLELRKWLTVMRDLRLLPSFLSQDWDSVWLQKFHGDANILPIMNLSDFYMIFDDPTKERMESYFTRGQRSTFPKLSMIKNRLVIERKVNLYSSNKVS